MSDLPAALLNVDRVRPATYLVVCDICIEAYFLVRSVTAKYLIICARFLWRLRLIRGRDVFTLIVWVTRVRHKGDTTTMSKVRDLAFAFTFRDSGYVAPITHTHPVAAKRRNDTVISIRSHIAAGGWGMFDPSPANSFRDTAFAIRGPRHAYSMQDLGAPLNWSDRVRSDEFVTLIDQDIHLKDLSDYAPQPICIYTMLVDSLSGVGNSSVFYFTSASTVVERVHGGATYVQELFDYGHDQTIIRHNTWFPAFTVYDVHRHVEEGGHKMVVFLTPASTHYMPLTVFLGCARVLNGFPFRANELAKLRNVTDAGMFIVGWFADASGEPFVAIKRKSDVGAKSCVRMPEKVYNALRHLSRVATKSWNASEAQRYTEEWKYPIRGADLILIVEYFGIAIVPIDSPNLLILPTRSEEFHDVPEAKAEQIAPAIVSKPGVVLAENEAARESYVEERMKPNQNTKEPPHEYVRYATEFNAQLIRHAGTSIRPSLEVILDEQTSAPQKARNKRELNHTTQRNPKVKVNLKQEIVKKEGPARGISTVATSHTWQTGAYARGIKPTLKKHAFYAVGKRPEEVAKMVRALADEVEGQELHYLIETDFSKMDETISKWLRENVFNPAMRRAYTKGEINAELEEVLANDANRTCYIGKTKINGGSKNYSGSGFTTDLNTIINAFFKFVVYRRLGFSIIEAFALIGPCYGDDGLCKGPKYTPEPEITPPEGFIDEVLVKWTKMVDAVADDLGLKVKAGFHPPKSAYFFLGRSYPCPRTSLTSAALPSSSLAKICVCIGPADRARANRLKGYYVTEKHVPLVGDYIRAVARVYGIDLDDTSTVTRESDRDLWYKVKAGPVPYQVSDEDSLRDLVAADLKLTLTELEVCCQALRDAKSIADIEKIKLNNGSPLLSAKWARV